MLLLLVLQRSRRGLALLRGRHLLALHRPSRFASRCRGLMRRERRRGRSRVRLRGGNTILGICRLRSICHLRLLPMLHMLRRTRIMMGLRSLRSLSLRTLGRLSRLSLVSL